jgi:hypothetical protein
MPVPEAGAERRQHEPRREALRLVAQVEQCVLGERLERLREPALLLGQRRLERRRVELRARREERAVAPDLAARDPHDLPVGEIVEERRPGRVDQAHARADELERPRVRKRPAGGGRDVDDDPHAGLHELLGRDPVEVGVVDDRDVLGPQALDEVFRPPPEARRPGNLAVHARPRDARQLEMG